MQSKIESAARKLKYKELIEKGSRVSKFLGINLKFKIMNLLISDDSLETSDVLETLNHIQDIVQTCENISAAFVKDGKVENASDYLMDSQVLKMSHELMGNTASKMVNNLNHLERMSF